MLFEVNRRYAFAVILSLFGIILIRTAWIGDDAVITLRTVLNFINGYGPRFNIDERVQAYTHPLWFLLLSLVSLVTRNVFASAFLLPIVVSLGTLALLLWRASANFAGALLAGIALVLSKAFIDFSTSGLENPLSHLLVLFIFLVAERFRDGASLTGMRLFFLGCALLYLTRPDLILMLFPMVLVFGLQEVHDPRRLIKAALVGGIPALVWTLFSIVYYGFPLPNTAYAKLGTGIPHDELAVQGFRYLLQTAGKDPLTLAFIALGMVLGLRSPLKASRALSAGIALYLVYVVSIGGDFMEGRFFTAPLFAAAIIVAWTEFPPGAILPLGCGVLALGAAGIQNTLFSDSRYGGIILPTGIADERGYYFQNTSLFGANKQIFNHPPWSAQGRVVTALGGGLGFGSTWSGPGMHAIDINGLADPLLSRLPARANPNWRIGHFARQLPAGYVESLRTGENRLSDPKTKDFYESIRIVTRGKLNSRKRLKEILKLNLNLVEKPDMALYRTGLVVDAVSFGQLRKQVPEGSPWNEPGNFLFSGAIEVALEGPTDISTLSISLDNNDVYKVHAFAADRWEYLGTAPRASSGGMASRTIKLEKPVLGVHKLKIEVVEGDDLYALGYIAINR